MHLSKTPLYALALCSTAIAVSAETKIAVWNMEAELTESLEDRHGDFADFRDQVDPDVVVLVEVNGEQGTKAFAEQMGWDDWYTVTSDLAELSTNVFFALELAIVSKIPIEAVTEFDTSLDGAHLIRSSDGTNAPVTEMQLKSDGIPHFGDTLHKNDRGTMRVDLANGLSIFPVHLKSNIASSCSSPRQALNVIEKNGFELSATLETQLKSAYKSGFPQATNDHKSNALKRERVIASVVREAEKAIAEGRTVLIGGDFNTAYELGKKGSDPKDCELQNFSCSKAPFPASACTGGDGFDDTLGILDTGLVGPTTWSVLSRDLGRTYSDTSFADKAIDHIAVPEGQSEQFSIATKHKATFGSDHNPVITIFKN